LRGIHWQNVRTQFQEYRLAGSEGSVRGHTDIYRRDNGFRRRSSWWGEVNYHCSFWLQRRVWNCSGGWMGYWWIVNWKGFGGERARPNCSTNLVFWWQDCRNNERQLWQPVSLPIFQPGTSLIQIEWPLRQPVQWGEIKGLMNNVSVFEVCLYCSLSSPNWWPVADYTGHFIMFSVITSIYNKKTPNAYAEPSTLLFSTSIAP
jgi:hypothetical protein